MSALRLAIVGDALLDRDVEGRVTRLCPDAPVPVFEESARRSRPGGAGLAAALAAADGASVTLITALADDPAGGELARAVLGAGVDLLDLGLDGQTAEKIRFLDGQSLLRLDRGSRSDRVRADGLVPALRAALDWADAVLVSDYGRGITMHPQVRAALASATSRLPMIWDPHPRGGTPVPGAALATPNLAEALALDPAGETIADAASGDVTTLASRLVAAWKADAVCITCGREGAVLADVHGSVGICRPAPAAGDPCGAGDRFAVAVALSLAAGESAELAVRSAVAKAAEFVRQGGAGAVRPSGRALPDRGHNRDGTVVATGGCFDLLHLGHVRTLEAAARLGDRLVVLLNSDRSVRELKGADRPLVGEAERAAMLSALACVDEVRVFDEPTPLRALRQLRPQVWAKGGDYELGQLPESEETAAWGGRTVILPYLAGRSTTRLIEEVEARVAA